MNYALIANLGKPEEQKSRIAHIARNGGPARYIDWQWMLVECACHFVSLLPWPISRNVPACPQCGWRMWSENQWKAFLVLLMLNQHAEAAELLTFNRRF